ncbi:GGDEF domain-containing protein [Sulfurimonas sp.]|uniref:GGDEF domain-containing protein n=1 Tax=Sulfurimonas sp. TaxID=2022749 RepID=UPI0035679D7B
MKTQEIEDIIKNEEIVFKISDIEKILDDESILKKYEDYYPDNLYKTILSSITHEHFKSNEEAKKLFIEIISHYKNLNNILQRDVGLVVASLDYLTNIVNILSEPKIIEEEKSNVLSEMATIDELTELYLRDVFDVVLAKEISESKRSHRKLSLLMIDIDDFKKVNDTYGHQKGDEVLKTIGKFLNNNIREMDMAARYGGEEIVILMPNTTVNQAFKIADKMRENISKLTFDDFSVKVSIGVGQTDDNVNSAMKLIETADKALYKAKNSGKNRVVK